MVKKNDTVEDTLYVQFVSCFSPLHYVSSLSSGGKLHRLRVGGCLMTVFIRLE